MSRSVPGQNSDIRQVIRQLWRMVFGIEALRNMQTVWYQNGIFGEQILALNEKACNSCRVGEHGSDSCHSSVSLLGFHFKGVGQLELNNYQMSQWHRRVEDC